MAGADATMETTVKVGGEQAYKQAIKGVYETVAVLKSEMKAVKAEFKGQEDSIESLNAKQANYRKQLELQNQIIGATEKRLQELREAEGDNSSAVEKMEVSLNNAKTAMHNVSYELSKTTAELDSATAAASGTKSSLEVFKQSSDQLNSSMKVLESEMSAVKAEFKGNEDSLAALTAKQGNLRTQLELQNQIVKLSEERLSELRSEEDGNAEAIQAMEIEVNKAKTTMFNMSHELDGTTEALRNTSIAFNEAGSGLKKTGDGADKMGNDIKEAGNQADNTSSKLERMAAIAATAGAGIASAMKVGVAAIAAVSGAALTGSASVYHYGTQAENSVAEVTTLLDTTTVNIENMQKMMLETSDKTRVEFNELAVAMAEALSSGIEAGEDGADALAYLEKNAKLAKAGFTDLNTVSSTTAKIINAYGMGLEDVDQIHKILMQTQNEGITTVGEMGRSLAQVTPTAAAMKVAFEQVGAGLSVLTAKGTPTAQATTQLNSLFAELGKVGTKGQKGLLDAAKGTEYAGASFQELMDKGVPLCDVLNIMDEYAIKNKKSLLDMFSSIEAGKAALSLSGSSTEMYIEDLKAMSVEADVVNEAYEKVSNTVSEKLAGELNKAKNTAIDIYQEVQPALLKAVEYVPALTEALGDLVKATTPMVVDMLPGVVDGFEKMIFYGGKVAEGAKSVGGAISDKLASPDTVARMEKIGDSVQRFASLFSGISARKAAAEFESLLGVTVDLGLDAIPKVVDGLTWIMNNGTSLATTAAAITGGFLLFKNVGPALSATTTGLNLMGSALVEASFKMQLFNGAQGLQGTSTSLTKLVQSAKNAATGINAFSKALITTPIGRVSLAIGVLATGAAVFYTQWKKTQEEVARGQIEERFRGAAATAGDLEAALSPLTDSFSDSTEKIKEHASAVKRLEENLSSAESKVEQSFGRFRELGELAGEEAEGITENVIAVGDTLIESISENANYQYELYKESFEKTGGVIDEQEQKVLDTISSRAKDKESKIKENTDAIQGIYNTAAENAVDGEIKLTDDQVAEIKRRYDEIRAIAQREQAIQDEIRRQGELDFIRDIESGRTNVKDNYEEMLAAIQQTETEGIESARNLHNELIALAKVDLENDDIGILEYNERIKEAEEAFSISTAEIIENVNAMREAMKQGPAFEGLEEFEKATEMAEHVNKLNTALLALKRDGRDKDGIKETTKELKDLEAQLENMDSVKFDVFTKKWIPDDAGLELAGQIKTAIDTAQTESVASATKLGTGTAEGFETGYLNRFATMKNQASKTVWEGLINPWKNALKINSPSKVTQEIGEDTGEGFEIGFKNRFAGIKALCVNLSTEITGTFDTLPASIQIIGADTMDGFGVGLESRSGLIKSKVNSVVTGIKQAFTGKQGLDINSPSRVTTEYGRYTGEGFAGGIDDTVEIVASAARGLANAALDGLNMNYGARVKALEAELEAEEKALKESERIRKEADLRKKIAEAKNSDDRIKAEEDLEKHLAEIRRDATKEELAELKDKQKEYADELKRRGDAITTALKSQYDNEYDLLSDSTSEQQNIIKDKVTREVEIELDGSNEKISIWDGEYIERVRQIDDVTGAALESNQKQIDAELERLGIVNAELAAEIQARRDRISQIDAELQADKKLLEVERERKRLSELNAAVYNAETDEARIKAMEALSDYEAELERKQKEETLKAEKDKYNEEIKKIQQQQKDEVSAVKGKITEIQKLQEADTENLAEKLKADLALQKDYYSKLKLLAPKDAAWLVQTGQEEKIKELLETYNPDWEESGKTFMDYLNENLGDIKPSEGIQAAQDALMIDDTALKENYIRSNKEMEEEIELVKKSIDQFIVEVRKPLGDLSTDAYDIAKHTMEGLLLGMEQMFPKIVAKAREISEMIRDAMEGSLEIESPSRVTRRIGSYVGQGVVLGMDDEGPNVEAAAKRLAGRLNLNQLYTLRREAAAYGGGGTFNTYNDNGGNLQFNIERFESHRPQDLQGLNENMAFLYRQARAGRGRRG